MNHTVGATINSVASQGKEHCYAFIVLEWKVKWHTNLTFFLLWQYSLVTTMIMKFPYVIFFCFFQENLLQTVATGDFVEEVEKLFEF